MKPLEMQYTEHGLPYYDFGNGYTTKVEFEPFEGKWLEKAKRELRETPENVEKGLEELRQLLLADKDLYVPLDGDFLMRFLRPCKFYAASAYEKMKKFYHFKEKYKDNACKNVTPVDLLPLLKTGILDPLPARDQDGRRILVIKFSNWDPKSVSAEDVFRGSQLSTEGCMSEPLSQLNGTLLIVDMAGFGVQHLWYANTKNALVVMEWIQDCIPVRLKEIHFLNTSPLFWIAFQVFKPFLTKKIRQRIYVHGSNVKGLLKYISPETLPSEYGGTMERPGFNFEMGTNVVVFFQKDYENMAQFGYNKKRLYEQYDGMYYDMCVNRKQFKEAMIKKYGNRPL